MSFGAIEFHILVALEMKSFEGGGVMRVVSFLEEVVGVHELMSDVIVELKKKHPKNQPCDQQIILSDINTIVEPVISERIDGDSISQYARNITHGSGGPSSVQFSSV